MIATFMVFVTLGFNNLTMAATTPDLWAATSFGALASTFNHNIALTTIWGDLGYVASFWVGWLTVVGIQYTATQAKYIQAKSDQNAALIVLNNTITNPCTFTFGTISDWSCCWCYS